MKDKRKKLKEINLVRTSLFSNNVAQQKTGRIKFVNRLVGQMKFNLGGPRCDVLGFDSLANSVEALDLRV